MLFMCTTYYLQPSPSSNTLGAHFYPPLAFTNISFGEVENQLEKSFSPVGDSLDKNQINRQTPHKRPCLTKYKLRRMRRKSEEKNPFKNIGFKP